MYQRRCALLRSTVIAVAVSTSFVADTVPAIAIVTVVSALAY
jgi:hypothetical protein